MENNLPIVARAIAYAGACESEQWFDLWARVGAGWVQKLPQLANLQILSYADLTDLQQRHPRSAWQAPVIVAVDEVQRFARDKGAPHARFLQQIHDASTTLPMTLVLAGLGDTQSVIRDLGLTHGLRPFSVGCFDGKEGEELTNKWFALTTKIMHDVAQAEAKGAPMSLETIIQKVDEACDRTKGTPYRIPRGYNEGTFVTHIIHCGALQETDDGAGLTCPIPSFQNYILRRGGIDPDLLPNLSQPDHF
ncbi:MAG: hypothetical protein OXE94_09010 [Aestuariivita sp.]|nr:hypothetical protein [Aestuariivita sp.]MCY4201142.1 hypothetical protein [Aestuariivita sp.]